MRDVEAGAGAVGVFIVAVNRGDWVLFHQVLDELEKGEPLRLGAGVGGVAVGIKAANIGDSDALEVVAGAVGADLLDRTASVDAAIGIYHIMIADVAPAEALVVAAYALHVAVGLGAGGGAMDDDFGDGSHGFLFMGLMGCNGIAGQKTKETKGEQADCPRCGRLAVVRV